MSTAPLKCLLALCFALVSCANKPQAPIKEAPLTPPPEPQSLWFLQDRTLPTFSVVALIGNAGSASDPKGLAGLAQAVGNMLTRGTLKQDEFAWAKEIEGLGAHVSASVGDDFSTFTLSGLSRFQEPLLQRYLEALFEPGFSKKSFAKYKKRALASRLSFPDDPGSFTNYMLPRLVFGAGHPYGHAASGTRASIKALQHKHLRAFYKKFYAKKSCVRLAFAGDFNRSQAEKMLEKYISKLAPGPCVAKGGDFDIEQDHIHLVHKDQLQQSQIRMFTKGVARSHPDYLALRVANMALGGMFGSRLMQHIRVRLGLTYGVYSYFNFARLEGSFVVSTYTRHEKLGVTLLKLRELVDEFVAKGITRQELQGVQNYLKGFHPRMLETKDSMAQALLGLDYYGVEPTYLKNFLPRVQALSLRQVNAAIKRHFKDRRWGVLVHGPLGKVAKPLKQLATQQSWQFSQSPYARHY